MVLGILAHAQKVGRNIKPNVLTVTSTERNRMDCLSPLISNSLTSTGCSNVFVLTSGQQLVISSDSDKTDCNVSHFAFPYYSYKDHPIF